MIWLCIVLYFIVGFVWLLITQILNHKGYEWLDYFEIYESTTAFEFRVAAI